MSGHSKWAKIKHKKAITDAKKGKAFSKTAQQIAVAARDGGPDLDVNFSLRLLVDKARAISMPAENVKRAIERGSGTGKEAFQVDEIVYEGYGPAKVSYIVKTLTDNKNRTVADLRKLFSDYGGNLGESGSVSWNFTQKGMVIVKAARLEKSEKFGEDAAEISLNKDEVELSLMDIAGVSDIKEGEESYLIVYTDPKELAKVRDAISELQFIIEEAELVWVANNEKDATDDDIEKTENFIEALEEIEDVQSIWTDVDSKL
ncbi:MAG: YebC/PmpR family DNA-binding transcriptional regulator [Candidatus Dojkabacteria bacterium]|nr:MAG: YebC/PmpR family DNA-binding transcriptional regulator [Candidatus Dojkabacteria bacterium]